MKPSIHKSFVANMHQKPRLRFEAAVSSEPLHCYRTFFLSFSPDNGHSRSRSLNDIDCGLRLQGVYECQKHVRSKSSEDALENAAQTTIYPLAPCHPALLRCPTPTGLPEFGSREAQELRLVPPSRFHRLAEALQKRVRQVEHNSESNIEDERSRATSPQQQRDLTGTQAHTETPADILRRMMGTVMPVSVPRPPQSPRRASLPRGVIRVSQPGPLTQAEDGSLVRGRFGNRASGHGICPRSISIHPLARMRDSSGLQDAIQEIEKACAREDTRQQRGEHQASQQRRRGNSSAARQQPEHDHRTTEASAAEQTLGNGRRAVQALRQQRYENAILQAQLRAFEAPRNSLDARVSGHRHANSSSTEYRTARVCELSTEETAGNRHAQMSSDQTVTSLSPDQTTATVTSMTMLEPTIYSPYSSFSYSSQQSVGSDGPPPAHAGDDVLAVNGVGQQEPDRAADTAQEQQEHPSDPKRLRWNIC